MTRASYISVANNCRSGGTSQYRKKINKEYELVPKAEARRITRIISI
jgi:hypothetical protein